MMNFTKSIVSVAFVTSIIFSGCSDEKIHPHVDPDAECVKEGVEAPKWVCVPSVEDGIVDMGVAEKTAAGPGMQRKMALADARGNLAQQIRVLVKDKVESFTRSIGVGQGETVDKVATAVSKQVAKETLSNSKQIGSWESPSGTLYVLMSVSETSLNNSIKRAVKTSFKNDEALWQEFKSKQALESLEKEFPSN